MICLHIKQHALYIEFIFTYNLPSIAGALTSLIFSDSVYRIIPTLPTSKFHNIFATHDHIVLRYIFKTYTCLFNKVILTIMNETQTISLKALQHIPLLYCTFKLRISDQHHP